MATTNAAEIMINLADNWIMPAMHDLVEDGLPRCIEIPFAQKYTIPVGIPTTGNEILRLFKFPAGAFIWDWRSTPSDMDAGTALTYSILTTNDADVTQLTLVSLSTNARAAAGSDRIDNAVVGRYVGNQWLCWKTGTAATTPSAGTLKCAWKMSIGVVNRNDRGPYMYDPEA